MLHTANQIRASPSFTFSFSGFSPPPPHPLHPLVSNSVKFTTAAAHASHNNALHCCAELSSRAFVFFDLCDRWGTRSFFCRGSHRRLLLDGPAPGWWPLRSSWCHPHRGQAWVRAFLSLFSFLLFLSPCLPAHSSVLVWSSFSFLSIRRRWPVASWGSNAALMLTRKRTMRRDIRMESHRSLSEVGDLKLNWLQQP